MSRLRAFAAAAEAAGKKVKCSGCATILRIAEGDGGDFVLTALEESAAPRPQPAAAAACPECHGTVQTADTFCPHCGTDLAAASARAAQKAEHRAATQRRRGGRARAEDQRRILSAGRWLLLPGVLFAVLGTYRGFAARREAGEVQSRLATMPQDEVVEIEGKETSVAELRQRIDFEVMMEFGIHYLLAAIMLGLYFWAQRSPFPAMLTGLCVYLVVVVLGAVINPLTLLRGWLWKFLVIGGLLGGMAAALKERAAVRSRGRHGGTAAPRRLASAR